MPKPGVTEKDWHDCPCGESIAVPDSPFGAAMLAEWRKSHRNHQSTESPVDRSRREIREREAADNRAIFHSVTQPTERESS